MARWHVCALVVSAGALLAAPAAAGADTKPVVKAVAIQGEPVVGATLTASANVTGDPAPLVDYQWLRCNPVAPIGCNPIDGAAGATYVVTGTDLAQRLAVRVRATNAAGSDQMRSEPTAIVTPAPPPPPPPPPPPTPTPTPTPVPTPVPTPAPTPTPTVEPPKADPPTFDQSSGSAIPPVPVGPGLVAVDPPPLLRPFPVVRIKGTLVAGGARVSLLRVRAPSAAIVDVRCAGAGCRLRRRTSGSGRIRPLERFLRAGTRITIRVSEPHRVGKYVRILIRDGSPPRRRDACLLPGGPAPAGCPPR